MARRINTSFEHCVSWQIFEIYRKRAPGIVHSFPGPFWPLRYCIELSCSSVLRGFQPNLPLCAHEGEWSTEHLPSWERVLLLEQLLLAKKRAYVSLAGSRLYQAACLVFVVLVPRPSFFLPLWFWEGELQRALRSLPCTPDPLCAVLPLDCAPIPGPLFQFLPVSGESSRPKDIQGVAVGTSPSVAVGKHCAPSQLLFWPPSFPPR